MNGRTKTLIIVLIGVVVAAAAGLYLSGMLGGEKEKPVKHAVAPIPLAEPFIINLADPDVDRLVKLNIAVQLEAMTVEDRDHFLGLGGGGHGGGKELGGTERVSQYPKFRDAVIEVTSKFTYDELRSAKGKELLKAALLHRFEEIAAEDTPHKPKKAEEAHHDSASPPFHIENVYFQEFAVQ